MTYLLSASAIIIYIMAVGWAADRRRADNAETAFVAAGRIVDSQSEQIVDLRNELMRQESRDGMTPEQRVQVGIDMQRVICELQRREAQQ